MSPVKRILVPLDFGAPSSEALEYAKTLAASLHAALDLLHVVPNPYVTDPVETVTAYRGVNPEFFDSLAGDAKSRLEAVLSAGDRKRFEVRSAVRIGDPKVEIAEYARAASIDLIVMATHGRTGLAHLFLGSVAERVVRTAPCPVLLVRATPKEASECEDA
jgi:nucleotide-binding universal stress UspA family protein